MLYDALDFLEAVLESVCYVVCIGTAHEKFCKGDNCIVDGIRHIHFSHNEIQVKQGILKKIRRQLLEFRNVSRFCTEGIVKDLEGSHIAETADVIKLPYTAQCHVYLYELLGIEFLYYFLKLSVFAFKISLHGIRFHGSGFSVLVGKTCQDIPCFLAESGQKELFLITSCAINICGTKCLRKEVSDH